jgi:MerR family copper efflux transcriptional regulator
MPVLANPRPRPAAVPRAAPLNIGAAARASGVSAKMIRYYESIGLIGRAERSTAGYRLYAPRDVHLLCFIKRARSLGFPIERVAQLVALWQDTRRASAEVKRIALAQIGELEQRIGELETMKRTLEHLARHCHGDQRPECPILDDLAAARPAARHATARRSR